MKCYKCGKEVKDICWNCYVWEGTRKMKCNNCDNEAIDKVTFDDNHIAYGVWLCQACQNIIYKMFEKKELEK